MFTCTHFQRPEQHSVHMRGQPLHLLLLSSTSSSPKYFKSPSLSAAEVFEKEAQQGFFSLLFQNGCKMHINGLGVFWLLLCNSDSTGFYVFLEFFSSRVILVLSSDTSSSGEELTFSNRVKKKEKAVITVSHHAFAKGTRARLTRMEEI